MDRPSPYAEFEGLVRGAGRQPALALDREDLDLLGAGHLEGEGLAGRERHAVAGRPGVGLEEERLAGHLGVPGQAAPVAEGPQVLPGQRPSPVVREGEPGIPVGLVARAQALVEDRQRGIDERHGVTGRQHEPVGEAAPGSPDVPAHGAGQQRRQQEVALRPGPAGMARLAVVEGQVDALVDDVEEHLVAVEVGLRGRVQIGRFETGRGIEGCLHGGPVGPRSAAGGDGLESGPHLLDRPADLGPAGRVRQPDVVLARPSPKAVPDRTETPASWSSRWASSSPVRPVPDTSGKT